MATILGFPVVLVFGWMYDVSMQGIWRTPPAGADQAATGALRHLDYMTLGVLAIAMVLILYGVASDILEMKQEVAMPASRSVDKPLNSIAVLPFTNVSEDPSNESFCDGISEEILHRLSDYRDMHVLARQSSFAFKGADLDVPRLSDVLGVRYLLQGSVRRDGDDLRISAQLVDDTGLQLWSKSYDRKLAGIFAIQSEIATAVAGSLAETIMASHVDPQNYEPDIDAYQQYLLGREYLRARTTGYQSKAIEHFEKAVAIDRGYPEAYAGHAIAVLLDQRNAARHIDRLEEGKVLIDRALSLNPQLAIGLAAKGLLLQMKEPPDNPGSAQVLRQALELDPLLPAVRGSWLANALISQGLIEEANAARQDALAHDPLDPLLAANEAARFANSGDFATAENKLRRLLDLPQPPGIVYRGLYSLYANQSRHADAIEIMKQGILAHPAPDSEAWVEFSFLAIRYAQLGMWQQAHRWQDRAEAIAPTEPATVVRRSLIYKLQGDYKEMNQKVVARVDALGLDTERLHPLTGAVIGAIQALTGETERGIRLLEASFDWDAPKTDDTAIDLMQVLAYAHKQNGNDQRADEIIELVAQALARREQDNGYRSPESLGLLSQNHAVARNPDAALAALETAIDSGWREYYGIVNDLRWAWLRDNSRFQTLMARVKADIDAQRARIERIDAEQDFGTLLEQRAMATSGMDTRPGASH
jgi:TolB-like protein